MTQCSSAHPAPPHAVRCVLDFFGPHPHILFGTDMLLSPVHEVEATMTDIGAAGLTRGERTADCAERAARLFGLRFR